MRDGVTKAELQEKKDKLEDVVEAEKRSRLSNVSFGQGLDNSVRKSLGFDLAMCKSEFPCGALGAGEKRHLC